MPMLMMMVIIIINIGMIMVVDFVVVIEMILGMVVAGK